MLLNRLRQRQPVGFLEVQAQDQQAGLEIGQRLQNLQRLGQHLRHHAATFQPAGDLAGGGQVVIDDQDPLVERFQHALVQRLQQHRNIHRFEEIAGATGFDRVEPGRDVATIRQEKQRNVRRQDLAQTGDLLQRVVWLSAV